MVPTSPSRSLVLVLLALSGCDEIATRFGGGPLAVIVADARGLSAGDPVRVHGVNVGRVSAVSVVDEGARIELELTTEVALHADACGAVRSQGLVGEAYMHLDPGEAEADLDGPLVGCQEPTIETATAESLAELAGLLEDVRRYVGALERGERALCTVPGPAQAPDDAPASPVPATPAPAADPGPPAALVEPGQAERGADTTVTP